MREEAVSLRIRKSRRWFVLLAGLIVGGVLAGGVIAAQFQSPGVPPELEAALREDPLVQIAAIPAENGLAGRGLFAQPTSAGFLCLWDAPSATSTARQGGCNRADDPFAGRQLFISLAYDGGPAPTSVTDARLIGLAPLEVADVRVVMSDGTSREIRLRNVAIEGSEFRAFAYRFKRADMRRGVGPRVVIARDSAGNELDRLTTGFGG